MTIHTLPHLKCIRLVSVRSSHLPFNMHQVGFRAFKSPLCDHRRANRTYQVPLATVGSHPHTNYKASGRHPSHPRSLSPEPWLGVSDPGHNKMVLKSPLCIHLSPWRRVSPISRLASIGLLWTETPPLNRSVRRLAASRQPRLFEPRRPTPVQRSVR